MSSTTQLDPEVLAAAVAAALAAQNGGKAANNPTAKPSNKFDQVDYRPIVNGTRAKLVSLIDTKQWVASNPLLDKDGSVVEFDDGSPVTFGDLATVDNVRPDGSAGRHFPVICGLHQSAASAAIDYLLTLPDKLQQAGANRNYRRNNGNQTSGNAGSSELKAVLAAMAAMQADIAELQQPAKPVAATGYVKKPVAATPQASDVIDLALGQVISINGKLWQVVETQPGKPRLNSTIV